ncbi:MAG TPA: hypothetical protein VHW23_25365 [Kofleriaceae bacterium]|nr:hypothetical protein [Kofleriaceae bacterium]
MGVSAVPFAHRELAITTVDVLPLDLQAWAEQGYGGDLEQVRSSGEASLMNQALDTLGARHYQVGAQIDWNGNSPAGTAMSREDLLATLGALAPYGDAVDDHPQPLPAPYLPARLGATTGADATLYLGGWAYVARPRQDDDVGQAILIALAVITVVAIVAIALSHDHKSHDHHGRDHRSSHAGGSTASTVRSGPASSGRVAHDVHRTDLHPVGLHRAARAADAFGRLAVDIDLSAPDWSDDDELPHEGEQPQLYLEATLIDNRTGLVVWHAHQTFPAQLGSRDDTARAMRTLLAQLPART